MRWICVFGFVVFAACSQSAGTAGLGQTSPRPAQLEFDQPDGLSAPTRGIVEGAVVRFDLKTRAIRTVEGLVRIENAQTAEEAARTFIESTFRLPFSDDAPTRLVLERDTDTLVGHRFIYQLYYARTDTRVALPMPGNVLIVNVNNDRLISYVSNETVPVTNPILVHASSAVPRGTAETAALAQHNGNASIAAAGLIIAVAKGTPVLLWRIQLLKQSPAGSFEVLLDGATGQVVSNRNTSVFKG